jgi:hypothetical protein
LIPSAANAAGGQGGEEFISWKVRPQKARKDAEAKGDRDAVSVWFCGPVQIDVVGGRTLSVGLAEVASFFLD